MSATAEAQGTEAIDPRAPRRVRHEPRRRELTVKRIDKITPHMIRVAFGGDLEGFTSLGFDDHVKTFFPEGTAAAGADQPVVGRDYTPRRYDAAANMLEIDFVLHDAGPATRWAMQTAVGQKLSIGGPRGSFIIPTVFDWHLLAGDDTALPAIGRRLSELPAGSRAVVLTEVDGKADEIGFDSKAEVSVSYVHRNGAEAGSTDLLPRALHGLKLPKGDFYAWVACDTPTAKLMRTQLIAENGANPKYMRCAGYWRRGTVAVHENIND
jgi:NADPH-dependent ferric siderophore reductase